MCYVTGSGTLSLNWCRKKNSDSVLVSYKENDQKIMTSVFKKPLIQPVITCSFVTMVKTKKLSEDTRSAIITVHKLSKGQMESLKTQP